MLWIVAIVVPVAFGVTLLLLAARTLLLVERAGRNSRLERADAIVVFGAAAGPDGPCRELRLRLEHAATLFGDGYAPLIVCSGGRTGTVSEARAMRDLLVERGVPAGAVEIDERGSSTRRTIAALAPRARQTPCRVIAVSSDYHMHRIASEARRRRIECLGSPARTERLFRSFRARIRPRLREVAASWWYALA